MLFIIKKPADREKVIAYLNRLPENPLGWKLQIERIRHTRSINQNRYFWYIMDLIATETGEDRQRIHNFYCQKFLTEETTIFGKTEKITKGTSQLNTKQFEDLMAKIRQDAHTELDIFCPLPNEVCNYD